MSENELNWESWNWYSVKKLILDKIEEIINNCQCSSDYFDALISWKKEINEYKGR